MLPHPRNRHPNCHAHASGDPESLEWITFIRNFFCFNYIVINYLIAFVLVLPQEHLNIRPTQSRRIKADVAEADVPQSQLRA